MQDRDVLTRVGMWADEKLQKLGRPPARSGPATKEDLEQLLRKLEQVYEEAQQRAEGRSKRRDVLLGVIFTLAGAALAIAVDLIRAESRWPF